MTALAAPPPLRADAARNRALVLDAAEQLFAERGLDVSMQEIADRAGVGMGTVFRRFASKEALVATIIEERLTALLVLARRAVGRAPREPWDAFASFFTDGVALHARNRGFMEAVARADVGGCARSPVHAQLVAAVRELVALVRASGELRPDVQAEDVGMLQCLVSRSSRLPLGEVEPELWRRACSLVLDGMRAGAASSVLAPPVPGSS